MSERDDIDQQHNQPERSHEQAREVFPEYAAAIVFGQAAEQMYPSVAAHVRECPSCRAELEELLALMLPAYQGQVAPAETYPQFDLSFLRPAPSLAAPPANWFIDELRRLVVVFTDTLLQSMQVAAQLQPTRGVLLYHYAPSPVPPGDLDLAIDIFADDASPDRGNIQVLIDNPALDPFDQSGMRVQIGAGDESWSTSTNPAGAALVAGVPLQLLSQLRIQIQLPTEP